MWNLVFFILILNLCASSSFASCTIVSDSISIEKYLLSYSFQEAHNMTSTRVLLQKLVAYFISNNIDTTLKINYWYSSFNYNTSVLRSSFVYKYPSCGHFRISEGEYATLKIKALYWIWLLYNTGKECKLREGEFIVLYCTINDSAVYDVIETALRYHEDGCIESLRMSHSSDYNLLQKHIQVWYQEFKHKGLSYLRKRKYEPIPTSFSFRIIYTRINHMVVNPRKDSLRSHSYENSEMIDCIKANKR